MMEFIKTQTGLKLKVNPSEFDSYRLYASVKADPNGFEMLLGVPYSRESVRKFKQYFSKFNMCYPLYGKRLRFLGYVGVTELIDNNEAVIEFYIVKKHRNKGYAYEACRALMKYTVSFYKGLNKFTALCSVDNLPSQNLLKKLGFKPKEEIVILMLIDETLLEKTCRQYMLEL